MLSPESLRMRLSLAKGFSNVTRNVENVIRQKNLSPEDPTLVTEGNWSGQELWIAAKIVSQFNFITSLELSLKSLLSIDKDMVKRNHSLVQIYCALQKEVRDDLESLFSAHVNSSLVLGRAYQTGSTPAEQKVNRPGNSGDPLV